MTDSLQALKARIETFEHIIAICDENPIGSRQLIGGELMGMRKALELFAPSEPYVGPGDGRCVDIMNSTPEFKNQYVTVMGEVEQAMLAAISAHPNVSPIEPEPEKAAPPSSVETAVESMKEHIEAVAIPSVPKPPTQKERILAAYEEGHTTGADIANATGIKRGSVDAVLSVLRREGLVADTRALPPAKTAEVPAKPRGPF